MVKRFTLLFILIALVGGVVSGTPLHTPSKKMMKCCDKAKSKDKSPSAAAADLCCAVNCSESVPTPSNASFNFSPSNVQIYKSIAEQIAALFQKETTHLSTSPPISREILPPIIQHKYIRYQSLLI